MRDGEDSFKQSVLNILSASDDKKVTRISKVTYLCSFSVSVLEATPFTVVPHGVKERSSSSVHRPINSTTQCTPTKLGDVGEGFGYGLRLV